MTNGLEELKELLPYVPQTHLVPTEGLEELFRPRLGAANIVPGELPKVTPLMLTEVAHCPEILAEMMEEMKSLPLKITVYTDGPVQPDDPSKYSLLELTNSLTLPEIEIVCNEEPKPKVTRLLGPDITIPKRLAPDDTTERPQKRTKVTRTTKLGPRAQFKLEEGNDLVDYFSRLRDALLWLPFTSDELVRILKSALSAIDDTTDWDNQAEAAMVVAELLSRHSDIHLHTDTAYSAVIRVVKTKVTEVLARAQTTTTDPLQRTRYARECDQVSRVIAVLPVPEDLVVTLEYLCLDLLFADAVRDDGTAEVPELAIERMRASAIRCLLRISQRYPDQQSFILELVARQTTVGRFRLVDGGSVLVLTALVVMMIQISPEPAELAFQVAQTMPTLVETMGDVIELLERPEWPGAEQLACSVVLTLADSPLLVAGIDALGKFAVFYAETRKQLGSFTLDLTSAISKLAKHLKGFAFKNPRYVGVENYHQDPSMNGGHAGSASSHNSTESIDEDVPVSDENTETLWKQIWITRLALTYSAATLVLVGLNGARLQAKAIRTLALLVDYDSSLVSQILAGFSGFKDALLVMRDALLDLVAKLVLLGARFDHFTNVLCGFLGDDSVMVKKRTIKVIDLWWKDAGEERKGLAAALLTHSIDDVDSATRSQCAAVFASHVDVPLLATLAATADPRSLVRYWRQYPPSLETVSQALDCQHVALVAALSEVVSLGQDQLVLLIPLLHEEAALKVLRNQLPKMQLRREVAGELFNELTRRLGAFPIGHLYLAVPSLVLVAVRLQMPQLAAFVKATITQLVRGTLADKMAKLCHLLGLFIAHGQWEPYRADLGVPAGELVTSFGCRLLMAARPVCGAALVAAVLDVCCAHPHLFKASPIKTFVDDALKEPTLLPVVAAKLALLLAGDEDTGTAIEKESFSLTGMLLEVAPLIVDEFLSPILASAHDLIACVEFLYLVVDQGLTLPLKCTATIVALIGHPKPRYRALAGRMFALMIQKHPSLIDFDEGLRQGLLHLSLDPKYFEAVYNEVLQALLRNLTKKFISGAIKVLMVPSFTLAAAQNIASMHFNILEEAVMVAAAIDRELRTSGQDVLERAQDGEDVGKEQRLKFLTILALIRVIMANYGIDEGMVEQYKPSRVAAKLKQSVRKLELRLLVVAEPTPEHFIEEIDNY